MEATPNSILQVPLAVPAGDLARQRLGLVVLVLLWAITWSVSHPYHGILHDGRLYTLQALARLHPDSLPQDVFLRFGSQDQYTLFSPLYAALIQWIGLEPAAAALTAALQLSLVLGAALLARQVVSGKSVLLGVSLLIAIPGTYGSDTIFTCIEPFVTPRMGAEALVLASLAAALGGRARLAMALLVPAILLHPLMAAAGLAGLLCLYVAIPRPGLAAALACGAPLLLIAVSWTLASGPFSRFDATWLELVKQRNPYLFLERWSLREWGQTAVSLVTLAVGAVVLTDGARKLARIALLTALGGLALTLLACDWLQLVLFTQLQPWRWQWLAVVVAALLLPAVAVACWSKGPAGRTAVLLLAAAWVFGSGLAALLTALSVAATPLLARLRPSEARLLLYGASGLLSIALAQSFALSSLFTEVFFYDPQTPLWIRRTAVFVHDGTLPFALALIATLLASHPRGTAGLIVLGVLAFATFAALLPEIRADWWHHKYSIQLQARFAPWRALIPPGKNVFWSELTAETWFLLERPSYLSVLQTTGVLFSRPAAMEMKRRADALRAVVPPKSYLDLSGGGAGIGPTRQQLEIACATGEFEYMVSHTALSRPALATLPKEAWHSSGGLWLYRCPAPTGT